MDDQNPLSKNDDDSDDDDENDDSTIIRGTGGERAERKRRHVSALEKREIREARLERKIKNVLAKPAVERTEDDARVGRPRGESGESVETDGETSASESVAGRKSGRKRRFERRHRRRHRSRDATFERRRERGARLAHGRRHIHVGENTRFQREERRVDETKKGRSGTHAEV